MSRRLQIAAAGVIAIAAAGWTRTAIPWFDVAPAARAQERPRGIATPVKLPPFDPRAPGCAPPTGLERALAFAQDNARDFMRGVDFGLSRAASDRGLAYKAVLAENDAQRMAAQLKALSEDRTGAVVVAPIDAAATRGELEALLADGRYVGGIVPPPATTILNAPQYLTGRVLAETAVAHIRDRLGGRASVVLLTHDSLEFLAPRFAAMRDALRALPGAVIVADISPVTVDRAGGAAMMRTIMLANRRIDVVLGADTVVLGALDAVRAAGRARPDQFFGGIDGEPDAVAELRRPESPYKASVSLASPIFGYAMGQHAADWLDGRSIPQAMDILPKALTMNNLAAYEADIANPGAVYADPARRSAYLRMYGEICHATRDRYLDFPWSSE